MGKENRVNQIISLLKRAQENGGMSVKELAQVLNVTERTVYSSLNYIEHNMAMPLQRPGRANRGQEGKYSLDRSWNKPSELQLALLRKSSNIWSDMDFDSNRIFKHKSHSGKTEPFLKASEDKIRVRDYELVTDEVDNEIITNILKSLMDNYELEITYTAFYRNQELTRRIIHPYNLVRFGSSWYVVAYCLLRQSIRTFKVDRIVNCTLLNTSFNALEDFNLDTYLSHSWGIMVEPDQKPKNVKLLFSPNVANDVIKYKYHPSQHSRWVDGGWLEVTFSIASVSEMKNWILSWGADVLILEPNDLREELVQLLKTCLKNLEEYS